MPAAIQASLHGQVARVLAARDAPAMEVARHLVQAGGDAAADSPVVDQLRRAVRQLGATDPDTALELLDRALALPFADEPERSEMLAERVGLLAAAGRLAEGEEAARAVLATDVPPSLRTEVELALAEVLLLGGNVAEAIAVLDEARATAGLGDVSRARVGADAAWARLVGFDIDGAAREAAEAVAWGEPHGNPVVLTSALAVQCRLAAFGVDFQRAIERGRAAVAASARGGTHAAHRTPHYYLGLSLMNAERVAEAIGVLHQGRRVAESAGLVSAAAMYHTGLISCWFHIGRWDEGTAEAEAARLLQADIGTRRDRMQMEAMLGLMWLHRGDEAAARDALARADADLAAPGHDIGGVIWLRWLRATFAEVSGDLADAARVLAATFRVVAQSGVESVKLWFGPEVVRLSAAVGDRARATEVAAEVARVAALAGTAGDAGAADYCVGMAQGDPDRLAAAVGAYRRSPRRVDLARAAEASGRVLASQGRTGEAVGAVQLPDLDGFGVSRPVGGIAGRGGHPPVIPYAAGWLVAALVSSGVALGIHAQNVHNGLIAAAFTAVGIFVIRRQPDNREARLFVATGVAHAVLFFCRQYGLHDGAPLPAARWVTWLGVWPLPLVLVLAGVAIVSFPDGRLPSPRWRPAVSAMIAVGAALSVVSALWPVEYADNELLVAHPLHVGGAGAAEDVWSVAGPAAHLSFPLVWAVCVVVRLRRARGDEARQLRWFVYAVAIGAAVIALGFVVFGSPAPGVLSVPLIAVAAGGAILKYRLYDIDVVIDKTLVVAAMAVLVTAVYVTVVVGVGDVVGVTARPNVAPSLAATAIIAVAFDPVRRWVQRCVDRAVYGDRPTPYEALARLSNELTCRVDSSVAGGAGNEAATTLLARGPGGHDLAPQSL
ncbi:MAG: hypothetical protein ACRDZS_00815 [Acidimicrobiales bacterium]